MPSLALLLTVVTLFAPVVLFLVAYDLRWIALNARAGRRPPWGAVARLVAAVCCHGGVAVMALHGTDWPREKLTFWLHMTLDPGLTFYALGLYDLVLRANRRASRAR